MLEPYRFTQKALEFLFDLVSNTLLKLDFDGWAAGNAAIKEQAENSPGGPLPGVKFSIAYP